MIPSSAPSRVPAHQAASPLLRCSNSSRSSPIPSRADATSPSSSLSSCHRQTQIGGRLNLTAGDIAFDDSAVFYRYLGKGGLRGRRELPGPALAAIVRSLADVGKDLSSMQPHESLWQAGAGPSGVSSATFYNRFRGYLRLAGPAALGRSRPPPHRRQAPPRCRRVGRVREPVPRSQLARCHHHLSPSPRRSARYGLAWRRACSRRELDRPAYGLLPLTGLVSVPVGRQRIPSPSVLACRPAFWADRCLSVDSLLRDADPP